jgi:two-component system chemotaxis response regulator CheB
MSTAVKVPSKAHFIRSGEKAVVDDGSEILTLLGSCVAVVLFDRNLRIGGMNHYLLPAPKPHTRAENPLNYGEQSILELLKEFKNRGSKLKDLDAWIVGGANPEKEITMNIGEANVEMAEKSLAKFGLRIKARAVGGIRGRKVRFVTSTGELFVRNMALPLSEPLLSVAPESEIKPKENKPIRVMIVDDSKPIRMMLQDLISQDPAFVVVAEAENPKAAEILRMKEKPDVMTLDIHMPEMDGVTYLEQLMKKSPIPAVMVTDVSLKDTGPVMRALELGAFDYVQKPSFSEKHLVGARLRDSLKAASRVNMDNLKTTEGSRQGDGQAGLSTQKPGMIGLNVARYKLILIGASTGGTEAIRTVIQNIPTNAPPIVMVQHMPPVFTEHFAARLDGLSVIDVHEVKNGEILKSGHAYLCPGGKQLKILEQDGRYKVELTDDPPLNQFKPSVDYMFQSAARLSSVSKFAAILLTGMGADGAAGMLALKQKNVFTVAQNESSCVVYGMPKAAIDLGAVQRVLSLKDIADYFSN